MLTTEDEAKTKRCHEGYAASPGASVNPSTDFVSQSFMVPSMLHTGGAGAAMATTAAPATAPIFCLGSTCMAWRWAGWIDTRRADGHLYGQEPHHTAPEERARVGFCGKAGKP